MTINLSAFQQQRRDTASNWTAQNPTLLAGELGYETDTGKWKVGTGSAVWTALAYTPWSAISAYPLATADIADDAVTAAKLANTSVTAGAYTTANITVDAQGRITSAASGAGLADGSVTTAKLADDAVTGAKLANDITIANNLTVTNDLTVNGTTTTIDSTTLVVEDKNIEIGKVSTPSDTTADGGGITLKGASDKTLTWVNSTDCWTFNQGLNLTAGTAGAPALVFNGDVNSGLFQPGADSLAIATAGAQRVTVDSSGRLLLGTTTAYGSSDNFVVQKTDGGARIGLQRSDTGQVTAGEELGAITFYSNDGDLNPSAQISAQADLAHAASDKPGRLTFSTTADGASSPTERLRIDSSGRLLVGRTASVPDNIGANAYANIVQIQGNAAGAGLAVSNIGTGRINISRTYSPSNGDDLGYLSFGAEVASTVERARITCSAEFTDANKRGGRLAFATCANGSQDPVERLRIDSSGNVFIGGTSAGTADIALNANGSATFAGTVSDSLGPLRRLKVDQSSSSFTLTAVYAGQLIRQNGSGVTITIPQNVFTAGDMVSIWNAHTGTMTIAQGTGATVYNSADGNTGNRTVAARGMVTFVCTATNEFVISGTGLS